MINKLIPIVVSSKIILYNLRTSAATVNQIKVGLQTIPAIVNRKSKIVNQYA